MLRLDANRSVSFCDGLTRRDFLHAGALASLGLTLPGWMAPEGRRGRQGPRRQLHHALSGRRPQPDRHLGPEAERAGRGPRPFQPIATNVPGMQITEIFPKMARHADKYFADPLGLPHGHGRPRHRPPDDADRPAVHRRHRASARRLRARLPEGPARRGAGPRAAAPADRPHRRQPAARPDRRLPRQAVRSVRPQRRSVRSQVQGARPAAARLHLRRPRRAPPEDARRRDGAMAAFEKNAQAKQLDEQLQPGLSADVQPAGPRGVRPGQGAGRRCATATAARASARAACWPAG